MNVTVEPREGEQLDRLITALLNASAAIGRAIEAAEHPDDADGEEVIGICAARLRTILVAMAEHHADEELALVTQVLAMTTLLVAGELGLQDCFDAD